MEWLLSAGVIAAGSVDHTQRFPSRGKGRAQLKRLTIGIDGRLGLMIGKQAEAAAIQLLRVAGGDGKPGEKEDSGHLSKSGSPVIVISQSSRNRPPGFII